MTHQSYCSDYIDADLAVLNSQKAIVKKQIASLEVVISDLNIKVAAAGNIDNEIKDKGERISILNKELEELVTKKQNAELMLEATIGDLERDTNAYESMKNKCGKELDAVRLSIQWCEERLCALKQEIDVDESILLENKNKIEDTEKELIKQGEELANIINLISEQNANLSMIADTVKEGNNVLTATKKEEKDIKERINPHRETLAKAWEEVEAARACLARTKEECYKEKKSIEKEREELDIVRQETDKKKNWTLEKEKNLKSIVSTLEKRLDDPQLSRVLFNL